MKLFLESENSTTDMVTLHVRVWIEMFIREYRARDAARVTLHVRVWIEIMPGISASVNVRRHPPREGVD